MDEADALLLRNMDPWADDKEKEKEPDLSQATTLVLPGGMEDPPKCPELPTMKEPEPVKEALKEEDQKEGKNPDQLRRLKVCLGIDV